MDARDFVRVETASQATTAYMPYDTQHNVNRIITAALPAFGILIVGALMLAAVL